MARDHIRGPRWSAGSGPRSGPGGYRRTWTWTLWTKLKPKPGAARLAGRRSVCCVRNSYRHWHHAFSTATGGEPQSHICAWAYFGLLRLGAARLSPCPPSATPRPTPPRPDKPHPDMAWGRVPRASSQQLQPAAQQQQQQRV